MRTTTPVGIVFFSFTPQAETRRKSWLSNRNHYSNAQLAHKLYANTSAVLQSTGLDVLVFDEHNQKGNSFGQRIANATQDAFNLGYKHLIIVGSDCPEIGTVDFNGIAQHLLQGTPVVGGTGKGGAYLIGISQEQFNAKAFESLRWRSDFTCADLHHIFQHKVASLQNLADLNNISDIIVAIRLELNAWSIWLKCLIDGLFVRCSAPQLIRVSSRSQDALSRRGPPARF